MKRTIKKRRISDENIYVTILQMCAAAGLESSVRPEDVAMYLYLEEWQSINKRVRLFGKQLAKSGDITILRKGKVVDPDDVKGVIRLQISEQFLR